MKTLILFSSRDGQTREIASFIASRLTETGINSDVINLHRATDIEWQHYDRVIIGASIRYGHFHASVAKFIKLNLEQIQTRANAFFSVNLIARKPDRRTPQTNGYTRKFLLSSPWQPTLCAVFAGALRYPQYRWFDRIMIQLIMKMTGGETDATKEIVFTDWQQVSFFADDFTRIPVPTERLDDA